MSYINEEIVDFTVWAYVDNDFKKISKSDVLGKWSIFFFTLPILPLFVQQN